MEYDYGNVLAYAIIGGIVLITVGSIVSRAVRRYWPTVAPVAGSWRFLIPQEFLKDAGAMTLAVVVLDLAIARTGWFPGMFEGWGWTHLVFYLLVGLGIAASQARSGKVQSVSYKLVITAAVIVVTAEFWHLATYCDTKCQLDKQRAAQATAVAAARQQHPLCTGEKFLHTYGTEPGEPVDKNAQCRAALWYKGHCIFVQQAHSTKALGPFCDKEGKETAALPIDLEYAWSADEPFVNYAAKLPPLHNTLVRLY
jgi:hypothetical protein